MRNFLFLIGLVIYLCSSFGPTWGKDVVYGAVVILLFSFVGKGVGRNNGPYYH